MSGQRKRPWDVGLVGWLCVAWAAVKLIRGLASLTPNPSRPHQVIFALFGAIEIRSHLWIGLAFLLYACAAGIAGYGLVRGRKFGCWVLLALVLDGLAGGIREASVGVPGFLFLTILLSMVFGTWLIFRRGLFRLGSGARVPVPKTTRMEDRLGQGKRPWDVRVVGWLYIVGGLGSFVLGVLVMIGIVTSPYSERGMLTVFGMIRIRSGFGLGLNHLVRGLAGAAAGYGLIKRHSLGWWISLIMLLEGAVLVGVVAPLYSWGSVLFRLGVIGLTLAWLVFRARLYHPFGGKSDSKGDK